jgi:plastocyanin
MALMLSRRIALAAPLALLLGGAAAAEVVRVKIEELAFVPAEVTAKVGDTIEWTNADFVDHTATAGSDFDVEIPAETTARLQLERAGTFDYLCRFHPNMTGTITVEPR